ADARTAQVLYQLLVARQRFRIAVHHADDDGAFDRDTEALAGYQKLVQDLRGAGIRAEMYQGNPKQFGKQLQYADRRGSPIAIIQGSEERAAGEVQIKDLIEGKRLSEEITDNEEWRAARPAQQVVKVEDMVAKVREVLVAQAGEG
ncbi:MAG: His/Gly/Thr/Pro-type tRNA ligase C-terminal domain-containing protein, partial [Pseudomonadota bacterium]